MTAEEKLKEVIIEKYGSVLNFSNSTGIPNSTVVGILNRGLKNSSVSKVIMICEALQLSVDGLAEGRIVRAEEQKAEIDIHEIIRSVKFNIDSYKNITLDGQPLTIEEKNILWDSLDIPIMLIRKHQERR
jgi:hypothetical protein